MSYLIRVLLPDAPGHLGALAQAFGAVDGNIQSVDIVETSADGTVMDDIVVSLPPGRMADELVTAASSVPGVVVDSIRPFSGRVDRRGQIEMLARVATTARNRARALNEVVTVIPTATTTSWAIVLEAGPPARRVAASPAAPEDDGSAPELLGVEQARILHPEKEGWIPASWSVLESTLVATPLRGTDLVMIVARVGGPDFLASEVSHLADLGTIIGELLRPKAPKSPQQSS